MGWLEDKKEELLKIKPQARCPEDLAAFWKAQLEGRRERALEETAVEAPFPSPYVRVYDVSFLGCDQTRIHGWFLVPAFLKQEKLPCVVHYHGFTGDRGNPADFLAYLLMGCCVLSCDCRAQSGMTGDRQEYQTGLIESVMMQGALSPDGYYVKFLYLDALRALDFAASRAEVDPHRIFVEGGSQGGALSLAAAALDKRPAAVLCDVPSNCEIQKRIENGEGSFHALQHFLKKYPQETERVFQTVSYFDLVHLAPWISCPVFASVGLLDTTCPAPYFFAAYNQIAAPKEVLIYPFSGHEGGESQQLEQKLGFLRRFLNDAPDERA